MSELEKPTWGFMQEMKVRAYETRDMNIAIFWQNEQIMKKLSDITFTLKERNV